MTPRRATVWHGQTPVGVLSGALRFTYDADWLSSGFAISLSLPLSEGEMDGEAFFSGLLPEGLARQRICRQYGLPESDDAALLLAIGRDCAGALAVLPEGEGHDETAAPVTMTEEDLARLVATRGQALPTSSERIRFSLAGAQDKVAVILDADGMRLPQPATGMTFPSPCRFSVLLPACLANRLTKTRAQVPEHAGQPNMKRGRKMR